MSKVSKRRQYWPVVVERLIPQTGTFSEGKKE